MDGNQEQLSDFEDLSNLAYDSWIRGEGDDRSLSILFPELPRDYFRGKGSPLAPVRWKPRSTVTPFADVNDLNCGEAKRKPAVVIGIKGSF